MTFRNRFLSLPFRVFRAFSGLIKTQQLSPFSLPVCVMIDQ